MPKEAPIYITCLPKHPRSPPSLTAAVAGLRSGWEHDGVRQNRTGAPGLVRVHRSPLTVRRDIKTTWAACDGGGAPGHADRRPLHTDQSENQIEWHTNKQKHNSHNKHTHSHEQELYRSGVSTHSTKKYQNTLSVQVCIIQWDKRIKPLNILKSKTSDYNIKH